MSYGLYATERGEETARVAPMEEIANGGPRGTDVGRDACRQRQGLLHGARRHQRCDRRHVAIVESVGLAHGARIFRMTMASERR